MRRVAATLLVLAGLACLPAAATAAGPPTIEYLAPHPLRNHEATVHFTVDPNGLETTYDVEYGVKAANTSPTTNSGTVSCRRVKNRWRGKRSSLPSSTRS